MNNDQATDDEPGAGSPPPRRVRLPGFVNAEDIGLGDVVKRATSIVGIKPCGDCAERAKRLNNWVVFSKKRS